uniref:Fibrinogen C-terminal domain-containing protein n=1 Tax=Macrostomum lignano TaxID=282301 RepID=A0A1I8IS98_9PLAT
SRSGAVCRRLIPPTEASPCCTRVIDHCSSLRNLCPCAVRWPAANCDPHPMLQVFVTSLSGCLISVQRRVDDSTRFDRSWAEYAAGFGPGPHSNHWIGLRSLNSLTWPSGRQLLIRMRLWNDTEYWANYSSFSVDSEDNKFQASISGFSGSSGLGDCMAICSGMKFSTFDSDNDIFPGSCSASFKGGWWYGLCHCTNPNGLYFYPPTALNTTDYAKSVCWSKSVWLLLFDEGVRDAGPLRTKKFLA